MMKGRNLLIAIALVAGVFAVGAEESPAERTRPDAPDGFAPVERLRERLQGVDPEAVRRGIRDLAETFPEQYPDVEAKLRRVDELAARLSDALRAVEKNPAESAASARRLLDDFYAPLLANPLLNFDSLLLVRRSRGSPNLGLPQNWQGNCALRRNGFDNEIARLSPVGARGKITTVYRPEKPVFVGDVDLHFDADRMLFSSIGSHNRWQIFEIGVAGRNLRQVTPGEEPDVDNYDACYLPDGRIVFGSTSRLRRNGRTRNRGPARRQELAALPAPLSSQLEILPGFVSAPAVRPLGHIPGGRVR